MAEVKTEQEPSIEEILESIRQIISEDGESDAKPAESDLDLTAQAAPAPVAAAVPAQPAPQITPAVPLDLTPEKPLQNKPFDAPLDLTDKIMPVAPPPPPPAPVVEAAPAPIAPPAPPPPTSSPVSIEMMDSPMTDKDKASNIVSSETANSVTDQLAKLLATNVTVENEKIGEPGKVTLEDMARELMKPLIKTWLDQNLPSITEKVVQREVEKLSRRAADR